MIEQNEIRNLLNRKFLEYRRRNPSYSMRAFALKLKVSSSTLSEILQGKRNISIKLATRLCNQLQLGPSERAALLSLFLKQNRLKKLSIDANSKVTFTRLEADQFNLISDWYHYALLSLIETKSFRSEPSWIASRLKIREAVVKSALSRLERLGLISKDPRTEQITCSGKSFSSSDGTLDLSIQKSHFQNLELAQASLETDRVDSRDFTSVTLATDPDLLPKLKELIREFRDRLSSFAEAGTKKEVYKLCIQLIPLTERTQ